ncbi:MAG: hypothetical protein KKF12_13625 [Proteobacteria bacterium]|nr:hypothetical protein [Desulfobacula sp.]MBU3952589.1 hypothetical protein [Pseudomonadota bacterium]MBU4131856.1 hypothetical protein [Pseudomonadota bacterium]
MAGINQINELTHSTGGVTANKPPAEKTGDFKNVLTRALVQTEQKDTTESPEMGDTTAPALGEINSIGLRMQDQSSIVSGKTDTLLGLLDTYASKLQDPGVSLKSIAPILEQINTKADSLLKESLSLGTDDKGLRDIATRTVVAARTEYVKFQRGDYLS